MTTSGLVSVISPAYNAGATIDVAIRSVLSQTWTNWEMLIGDDGSTDDTIDRVEAHGDPRIRLLRNERNLGPALTRNRLIREANGQFIAFLDTDDAWLPDKLEAQLDLLRESGAGFCCAGYLRRYPDRTIEIIPPPVLGYADLLRSNAIPMLTVVIDRHRFGQIEFEPLGHEDYQLWLNLLRPAGICVTVQRALAVYSAGNTGSVSGNKLRAAWWTWRILRREPIPIGRKLVNFAQYAIAGLRKAGTLPGSHRVYGGDDRIVIPSQGGGPGPTTPADPSEEGNT